MKRARVFISIYFSDTILHGKKKGDITLAFNPDDHLYKKVKDLGSSEIKKILGINSYRELLESAEKEDRSISNFIKHKLRSNLKDE